MCAICAYSVPTLCRSVPLSAPLRQLSEHADWPSPCGNAYARARNMAGRRARAARWTGACARTTTATHQRGHPVAVQALSLRKVGDVEQDDLFFAHIGHGKVEPHSVAVVVAVGLYVQVVLSLRHQLLHSAEVATLKVAPEEQVAARGRRVVRCRRLRAPPRPRVSGHHHPAARAAQHNKTTSGMLPRIAAVPPRWLPAAEASAIVVFVLFF